MYNKQFWELFFETFGKEFDRNKNKKYQPIIFFEGLVEDNLDPKNYLTLKLDFFGENIKADVVFYYPHEDKSGGTVETKIFLLPFDMLVEVSVKVNLVDEQISDEQRT